ncbi:hypothetical protein A3860_23680 [Niastella vici]|uniref:Uncharacterized protein n=1 Tax=Niastella vici TaxID=1703345 RepID=A0A1V9FYC3_9BACT|nr:hypothetical protein A3860_23680 [Niastella vici]
MYFFRHRRSYHGSNIWNLWYWYYTVISLVKYNKILVVHQLNWFGTVQAPRNLLLVTDKSRTQPQGICFYFNTKPLTFYANYF